MATFKAIVKAKRKDGFYPVYIRCTHKTKLAYMPTEKYVTSKGLSRSGEIEDPYVLNYCAAKIVGFVEALNKKDIEHWSVREVVNYLLTGESDISFSKYARKHNDAMFARGQARTAHNYQMAYQHLERFAGTANLMFSQLTSQFVNSWIESLSTTKRAKEMYPICVRQICKAAMLEYNDYDNGVIRIKTNAWPRVKIPQADTPEKLAITAGECRAFFAAPLPESKMAEPLTELGHDVAMMVLCLAGINTVDLYNAKKVDYRDGVLTYKRSKTRRARIDDAYMEMRVPSILYPIFEKYAADDGDEFLFRFHQRFSSSDSFGTNVNVGIKQICESIGIQGDDRYCVYTFRHTWSTVAQNDCGATLEQVGFALNHSQRSTRVTRGYVKIDYSPAWELNERVIDFIFCSDVDSSAPGVDESRLFRFSAKHLIRAAAYFRGRMLGEIEDTGYNNVDEVITALTKFVPEDVPQRSMVQFRIEIVDKGLTQMYERMKGKSF